MRGGTISEDTSRHHASGLPMSARGVLAEIVAIVESYGTGGVWLSRSSPLIAKARLACLQDRLVASNPPDSEARSMVIRRCVQELMERIDTARALLDLHNVGNGPVQQSVARLNALRDLLDVSEVARIINLGADDACTDPVK